MHNNPTSEHLLGIQLNCWVLLAEAHCQWDLGTPIDLLSWRSFASCAPLCAHRKEDHCLSNAEFHTISTKTTVWSNCFCGWISLHTILNIRAIWCLLKNDPLRKCKYISLDVYKGENLCQGDLLLTLILII